jgi:hypothetical protein
VNMANEQNLKPFKKGYDVRRNYDGAPRKVISHLSELGYTNREIVDTMMAIVALTQSELQEIIDNESNTALERTVAKAVLKGLEKGSLYNLETLITRSIGKPKETQQVSTDSKIEVVFINGKTIL